MRVTSSSINLISLHDLLHLGTQTVVPPQVLLASPPGGRYGRISEVTVFPDPRETMITPPTSGNYRTQLHGFVGGKVCFSPLRNFS